MARSFFERHGGFATVSKIVMRNYDHVIDSNVIGPYFENVDMPRLIDRQTKFVASIVDLGRARELHRRTAADRGLSPARQRAARRTALTQPLEEGARYGPLS